MSMKEKIMPPLVLTLICVITSALLVAAYNITYVDTTGVITDELASGLTEIYGGSDGFDMLMNDDGTVKTYDGVTSVITNGSGTDFTCLSALTKAEAYAAFRSSPSEKRRVSAQRCRTRISSINSRAYPPKIIRWITLQAQLIPQRE